MVVEQPPKGLENDWQAAEGAAAVECGSPEKQERGAVPCGMAQQGGLDGSLWVAHDRDQQILLAATAAHAP